MTIKAADLKVYGNKSALCALLPIMTKLAKEGVTLFKGTPKERKVYVIMAKVLGDNLGLHCICGFSKTFTIKRPCMYCEILKTDLKYVVNIDEELTRTVAKYDGYFLEAGKAKEYGVDSYSVLNNFPHFHVIENLVVDPMHDVKLGYIHFFLHKAIKYFLETYPNFNLKLLNNRIQSFDYGHMEQANKPGVILKSHIKKKLHLNASESITLLKFFPLIVYDLIPYPDPIYQLLLRTILVVERIYAREFNEQTIIELDDAIIENKRDYIIEFDTYLKPKDHHMLHYRKVIEENGPLRGLSTIRLEAKHQVIRNYTNNNKNRRLICYGVSKKLAFEFAYLLWKSKKKDILARISDFTKGKEDLNDNIEMRTFVVRRGLDPNDFFSGNFKSS